MTLCKTVHFIFETILQYSHPQNADTLSPLTWQLFSPGEVNRMNQYLHVVFNERARAVDEHCMSIL